jgi:Domain of unknown function (DUF5916)
MASTPCSVPAPLDDARLFTVRCACVLAGLLLSRPELVWAQTPAPATPPVTAPGAAAAPGRPGPFDVARLTTAPVIDGVLDDGAWAATPLPTGDGWRSYDPLNGDTIPQETTVWVAYDDQAVYVAFKCDDPDPAGVKTSITRRDNIFPDDWVGLSLDALGTGQTAYHLMINPSGIQLDMINTVSGDEDASPDWVWESAGKPTPSGYAVEIRLPLQMLRFRGGDDVRMGVLFWRRVSRTGVSVAWPALRPGRWVFDTHASLRFPRLAPVPVREGIPSVTYAHRDTRADSPEWRGTDTGEIGLSGKWGLTSTVTLEATLNPDFSQVESDAVQVEVNQRFPVFFSEKRPFFMEGAGAFNLAGNAQGDASMLYAVHTRRIVDPMFGAKLTGSAGRLGFASLTAVDQGPGRVADPEGATAGREKLWHISRVQLSLSPGSYAGALGTWTSFAGRTNGVAGADLNLRIGSAQRLTGFVLGSWTEGGPEGTRRGVGTQVAYGFRTHRIGVQSQVEHYDEGFVMDPAFLNRVGITNGWAFMDYSFYPDKTRHPWLRRVTPFTFVQGGRDRLQGADEYISVSGLRVSFTRQGFFLIDQSFGREAWGGRQYDSGRTRASGSAQVFRWLRAFANVDRGGATYYDAVDPFQGDSVRASVGGTLQPGGRLSQSIEFQRVAFDRASTGQRVYTVSLLNARTTYQFTKAIAARAIVQYDGQRHRVLTDFLGSYEPRPGTVVFAGYGALYERRTWDADHGLDETGQYLTTRRGLFFKASYLFRF